MIQLNEAKEALDVVEHDTLTGLLNREGFYHNVAMILRNNPEAAYNIIVIDIEHFKLVNDTYGVAEGDNLLKFMARQISKLSSRYKGICGKSKCRQVFPACSG